MRTGSGAGRLLVVDGSSLTRRAFYSLPIDSLPAVGGQHTNGVYGFLAMLITLIKTEQPTHLAIAFDTSSQSFRTRTYPAYQSTRADPAEFCGQLSLLRDCLTAMSIPVLQCEDVEADDILATLAARAPAAGLEVLLCSGGRGAIQLVSDDVTVLHPSVQGISQLKRYDRQAVVDRFGVPPELYPDLAALVGEPSDNLTGVPRVGEKTAAKWLAQFGSLEALLARAGEISGAVGASLRDHIADVRRNRSLNRLLTDVDLPVQVDDLVVRPFDQQLVQQLFARLQFHALVPRLAELDHAVTDQPEHALPAAPAAAPTPPHTTVLHLDQLLSWLERHHAELGVTITTDRGLPVSIGVSSPDEAVETSWSSEAGVALRPWLESAAPKVLHDAKPQIKALHHVAGIRLGGLVFDTIIAGWLILPSFPDKTLSDLVDRYLDETTGSSAILQPAQADAGDAGQQAWRTLKAAQALRARLTPDLVRVLTEIEIPAIAALADMELAGVAVSHTKLATFSHELGDRAAALAEDAFTIIDHPVNLGSPQQLQQVLFDELGLPPTRRTKTGYSTDAEALAELQLTTPHPFLDLLLRHRETTKLRQIIESLDRAIDADERIHTTYQQTGSQTGRLSSANPNLQNIPVRTEEGRKVRSAFETGRGYETLLTADYSQIEMRIMAHLSGDAGLIEAFNSGEDLHRFVGARVFGVAPADVTAAMRTKTKAMSYGLVYGLSAFGLARQLRIGQDEARQLMTEYFTRFGAVRDYLRATVEQARIDGYTQTIFGRRRPFPDLTSPNRALRENAERAALNAPIQGAAADIMKIALARVHHALIAGELRSRILLQIHDELVIEVAPGERDTVEGIVRTHMASAATLAVPLEVHIGAGADWHQATH